ncbi:MAG: AAA family ATPase, partial [Oceanidesulfovibrio sp.]
MHIRRLDLRAFGPFTDKILDFGGAGAGIHILYGPNEAGKSSAREALGDFFFGIPRQTDNDFLHPYKNMAICAELALANGRIITASRYKRDKNDLVDGSNEPIDEDWWRHAVLGGFERTFFSQMFAIGHETLRQGTRGLLEGGGDLGETLFAAASGIANLRAVLDELDKEREALFKRGGSKQPIAEISSRIRLLQKEEKELTARPDEYAEKQASLRALRRQRDEAVEQLEATSAEAMRLQRRLSALEDSLKHRRILQELDSFGVVRSLPGDFRERRKLAESAFQNASDRM